MTWRRLSSEAIACGEWIISRTRHSGIRPETVEIYSLWRGSELVGMYDSADEAKAAAKEMAA
jgi:hypothetical protein